MKIILRFIFTSIIVILPTLQITSQVEINSSYSTKILGTYRASKYEYIHFTDSLFLHCYKEYIILNYDSVAKRLIYKTKPDTLSHGTWIHDRNWNLLELTTHRQRYQNHRVWDESFTIKKFIKLHPDTLYFEISGIEYPEKYSYHIRLSNQNQHLYKFETIPCSTIGRIPKSAMDLRNPINFIDGSLYANSTKWSWYAVPIDHGPENTNMNTLNFYFAEKIDAVNNNYFQIIFSGLNERLVREEIFKESYAKILNDSTIRWKAKDFVKISKKTFLTNPIIF